MKAWLLPLPAESLALSSSGPFSRGRRAECIAQGCTLRDAPSHRRPGNQSRSPHGDAYPERARAWENRKVSAYAFFMGPWHAVSEDEGLKAKQCT